MSTTRKKTVRKKSTRSSRRQPARKRPVEVGDLKRLRIVSDPQPSPDGSRIVFCVKDASKKKASAYDTNLWTVGTDGSQPRPFTRGGKDRQPRWSPDGSQIAFIGSREDDIAQVYLIPASGGEARRLTDLPEGTIGSLVWSPIGGTIAISFRPTDPQWTQAAKKEREQNGASLPARVLDDWWYRLDGDGYFNAQRFALYLIDITTGEHRCVYDKDALGGFSFDFSPDGKEIVLATNRDRKAMIRAWKDEIVRLNLSTGRLRPLKQVPEGTKSCVKWSPDGRTIAWAGREGKDSAYGTDNLELWTCSADGSSAKPLTADEDYCLMAITSTDTAEMVFGPNLKWSPDSRRLYLQIGWHGESHVASIARGGGKITFHTNGAKMHQLGGISRDGSTIGLTVANATTPDEVAGARPAAKRFEVKPLTNLNGPVLKELDLAPIRSQWINSADGTKVQVWSLLPPEATGKANRKKHPTVLEIHGGPHAQYGVGFFFEFQLLAAQGYAVFYSNPRGSKGYGRDFCSAIRGAWGGKDWEDIQAVTRFMQQHERVDRKRMGIMGGSYGGYMTNWAISHCHDFAGAITDRCVSNLHSMFGTSDFTDEPDRYWEGNSWNRTEARWKQSPLKYFGNVKTPTLIIHSEGDLRCNIEQAEQVFTALKLRNVPTRFVRYPATTSHGLSRGGPMDLRLHRLEQILDWWERWIG